MHRTRLRASSCLLVLLLLGCPVEVDSTDWEFTGKETLTYLAWQGLATDGNWWYFSGPLSGLHRAGSDLEIIDSNFTPIPLSLTLETGINHIGDIDAHAGHIYAPYEVVGLEYIYGNQGGIGGSEGAVGLGAQDGGGLPAVEELLVDAVPDVVDAAGGSTLVVVQEVAVGVHGGVREDVEDG